ncbi:transmembrane protein, putative [Rhizoctonia solani AG-3 Rhs1AP]|uniref:Transmembrane protein, putative n=1 Tax=Rhizoctonia solani AG-3 Rhs1AP TaxID=1086054 RepID=X8JCD7_9AGAM|nr:transmembrane protein, putative [Rhizoctonia solani AG-3 Rhs1AP]
MVQLRISIVFVALNAFFAAYALPVEVIGLSAMQSRQLPQSPPIVGQDDLRVPPQARAWEKRQRNRQGPGSGPIPEQVQAPAPQAQAARPNTNTNAQLNRRPPPQARNIGVVMRSLIANEGLAPEDIQLRNLQERQSVQPFPKQNDPTPPPPELARQPPLPQTPGRLMKMEERRQVGRQEQKPQDQPPQDQNNQARSPNPSLTLPATGKHLRLLSNEI